jgi:hypothetical protein
MAGRGVRMAFGFLALAVASSAEAQGNLDQGKTAAQLYASDCAMCHKSPQSVSDTKWFFGLESFLRQHYTSSRESAAVSCGLSERTGQTLGRVSTRSRREAHEPSKFFAAHDGQF